jgi:hypothetical protein
MVIRYNYLLLLIGLLMMLLGGAVAAEYRNFATRLVMDITLVTVLILGVWTLTRSRAAFMVGWALAGITLLLGIATLLSDAAILRYVSLLALLIFFFMSCVIAVLDVLFGGRVDTNRLMGAACIYLMSGTIWGIVYFFLHVFDPSSFEGVGNGPWNEQLQALIYYSFVTLTTLGFGEITPVEAIPRVLSYLEAVLGQMYLTVLVAALVGMHIATHHVRGREPGEVGSP